MPHNKDESLDNTTTNEFVSALKMKITNLNNASIVIYNGHDTYEINWKVLVSNDPEGADNTWAEDKVSAELGVNSAARHVLTGAFIWVDVQIESATDDEHSDDVDIWIYSQRG